MSASSPEFGQSLKALQAGRASGAKRLRTAILVTVTLGVLLLAGIVVAVTQPLLFVSRGENPPAVAPARLAAHVHALSVNFSPRDFTHTENLDRAAAYIRDEFTKAGALVTEQPFQVNGRSYRNVVASFGPQENETVIVGAHYDGCQPYPAADDNASGVAGLIELGYLLGAVKLAKPVQLVAYTLEEPPFFRTESMGSAVHAESLKSRGVKVKAMISLEMIGYFSDASNSQGFPNPVLRLLYPTTGNYIAIVGDMDETGLVRETKRAMRSASDLPVCYINAPRAIPGIDFSDQLNYWKRGYPAVMITDTAFYRNRAYHTQNDTEDRLDYRRMAQVVEGVYVAIGELIE
jgi:Zn-dependent M28 family amino/carboxypeptidase